MWGWCGVSVCGEFRESEGGVGRQDETRGGKTHLTKVAEDKLVAELVVLHELILHPVDADLRDGFKMRITK